MSSLNESAFLRNIGDTDLFHHVVQRLKEDFRNRYKTDCRHGCFSFVIYNGRFVGIEENLKHRVFWMQPSSSKVHQQGRKA